MNDSDDELLSSAIDGLVEDEDWTDTSWAQPVLPRACTLSNRWSKDSTSTNSKKPPVKAATVRHGDLHDVEGRSGPENISSLVREVKASEGSRYEPDLLLKTMQQSVAVCESALVNRLSLNDNKAGMEGLDKEKINHIIHTASKGSKFYENERKKEEQMKHRIEEQKQKVGKITDEQLQQGLTEADRLLEDFEHQRDLSHTIVHIDMDAFYAAVEMRDNPSLKDKPMAVGGTDMLSTSNYHARKFGVRAAMPGFIAKKLCPDLIIVPTNFEKYTAVSKEVRAIMSDYDPNFCPMSLDEAYLDITKHLEKRLFMSESERSFLCRDKAFVDTGDHCVCDLNKREKKTKLLKQLEEREAISGDVTLGSCVDCGLQLPPFRKVTFGTGDEEAVQEMRTRIEQKTRLTASAGIAPNMMLAKVCSDKNKPNGQYKIPASREAVLHFIRDLSTRKISGIGKVSETMLNSLGVYTCTDLYEKRALLYHLYSPISFNYFMRICLGVGSTTVERDNERKSMSTERTFSELSKPADLYKKCEELCESLAGDLTEEQMKGKTVTLKLKTVGFDVKTRAHTLAEHTADKDSILQAATDLLKTEIQACHPQPLRLRLMGVRMSGLLHQSQCKSSKQNTITGLLKKMAETANRPLTDNTRTGNHPSEKITPVGRMPGAGLQTLDTNETLITNASTRQDPPTIFCEQMKEPKDVNNVANEHLGKADKLGYQNDSLESDFKEFDERKQQQEDRTKQNWEESCKHLPQKVNLEENVNFQTEVNMQDKKQKQENLDDELEQTDFPNHCLDASVYDIEKKEDTLRFRKMDIDYTLQILKSESETVTENTLLGVTSQIGNQVAESEHAVIEHTNNNEPDEKAGTENLMIYTPGCCTRSGRRGSQKSIESRKRRNSRQCSRTKLTAYVCPVCCQNMLFKDLNQFNEHIDDCMTEKDINSNHYPAAVGKPEKQQGSTMENTTVTVGSGISKLEKQQGATMANTPVTVRSGISELEKQQGATMENTTVTVRSGISELEKQQDSTMENTTVTVRSGISKLEKQQGATMENTTVTVRSGISDLEKQQGATMENTTVTVKSGISELDYDESKIGDYEKTLTVPEVIRSSREITANVKGNSEASHIECNRNNASYMNSELLQSKCLDNKSPCVNEFKMNIVQSGDSEGKERITETDFPRITETDIPRITETDIPMVNDLVKRGNNIDSAGDVNRSHQISFEEFDSNKTFRVVETPGTVKIDAVIIEDTQAMESNVTSSLHSEDPEKVKLRDSGTCVEVTEAPGDIEYQCDIISSTNENDNVDDDMVGNRNNQILKETDLPSLGLYDPDLIRSTKAENNDRNNGSNKGFCEFSTSVANNHDGNAILDSTNNNESMDDKLLNESKVEKLIESLIERTIADDTIELDCAKGSTCKTFQKDTKQLELDVSSESSTTVHDNERPCGSDGDVIPDETGHSGCVEDSTNEEYMMQEEIDDRSTHGEEITLLVCPICNIEQRVSDLTAFNDHVDSCLSRGTISAILKEQRGDSRNKTTQKRCLPTSGKKSAKRQKTNIKMPSCRSITSFFQGNT